MPAETTRYGTRLRLSSISGDSIRAALVEFGARESTAEDDASVLLAALEGALVLSRASQSTQPLDTVQRFFTTSLAQAAQPGPKPSGSSS